MKRAPTAYRKSMLIVKDMELSYTAAIATQTAMPAAHMRSSFASQSGQHLLIMAPVSSNKAPNDAKKIPGFRHDALFRLIVIDGLA